MKRAIMRRLAPAYPGYQGDVKTTADFAKCGIARQTAILNSLSRLMETSTQNLARADERLAEAAKAVQVVQEALADERAFLRVIASTYAEFSQALAASAIEAAGAGETTQIGSTDGESAVAESETPK